MARLGEEFVAIDLPDDGFSGEGYVPAGWYNVQITEAELKTTRKGNGKYIKLRLDIISGAFQGRVIFANINTHNPNPVAQDIGRAELRKLMEATEIDVLDDTDQLIFNSISVKVTVKDDPVYGKGNEVRGYAAYDEALESDELPGTSFPSTTDNYNFVTPGDAKKKKKAAAPEKPKRVKKAPPPPPEEDDEDEYEDEDFEDFEDDEEEYDEDFDEFEDEEEEEEPPPPPPKKVKKGTPAARVKPKAPASNAAAKATWMRKNK